MPDPELETLVNWFRGFADYVPSELYRRLAPAVVEAPDVLELMRETPAAQRLPMLLFAAVHAEVLRESASYPADGEEFVAFCREHADALRPYLRTRSTQTNEVGRCAYLLPLIAAASDGRPLALIEVGASAGLNLNLDHYAYDYVGGPSGGDRSSPVRITCELRAGDPPLELPPVALRLGIDLAPAPDPGWLRACVFADQPERLERLDAALELAREHPPPLLEGDALELLPGVLEDLPPQVQPVVFHTAVAAYLSDAERERLDEIAAAATHVTAERGMAEAQFGIDIDGREVGRAHPHGRWLEWAGAGDG